MIQVPALARPVAVEQRVRDYDAETRAIEEDGITAAADGKQAAACPHERGTWRHQLWLNAFASEKLREKVEGKRNG
ncbi:MAG TPA: Rmf/CrpP family protein [Acidovorax sp.]|nr:Rmf/CrpP family protein [Acidovorax sp.]